MGILHGDSPAYADDVDAPDPVDGSYVDPAAARRFFAGGLPPWTPSHWSPERADLHVDEMIADRATGAYDDAEVA